MKIKQKPTLNILIIEDDKYMRLEIKEILGEFGIVKEAKNIHEGKEAIDNELFDLVITDIELEDKSGLEIIPLVVKTGTYCIVVSSYEGEDVVEAAYNLGVKHFLSKFKLKELLPVYIKKFIQDKNALFDDLIKNKFITQESELSKKLKELFSLNLKNKSLFISGNTGTGKSLLGKIIHEITSPESNFIHLNCSEISESLIESELFGHEKGAFTGADHKKDGKLKLANGGTLFLDEIATMSLGMQQKLLKALDEKTFYPVGATQTISSHFTLISATCENIHEKISNKKFREDLYYRITDHQFELPDLKNRNQDIEELIKYFQKKQNRRFIIKNEALNFLKSYSWPGNVRELEKLCEKMSQERTGIINIDFVNRQTNSFKRSSYLTEDVDNEIREIGLKEFIKNLEKIAVLETLKRNNNKITASIKELKISTSAFYRIIQDNKIKI